MKVARSWPRFGDHHASMAARAFSSEVETGSR